MVAITYRVAVTMKQSCESNSSSVLLATSYFTSLCILSSELGDGSQLEPTNVSFISFPLLAFVPTAFKRLSF